MKKIFTNLCLLFFTMASFNHGYSQCAAGTSEVTIEFTTLGGFAGEVQWDATVTIAGVPTTISSLVGGTVNQLTPTDAWTGCIDDGTTIDFVGCDTFGDGWNGHVLEVIITEDGTGGASATQDGCIAANVTAALEGGACPAGAATSTIAITAGSTAIVGCTNSLGTNYNPCATTDDGSCLLPLPNDDCANAIDMGTIAGETCQTVQLDGATASAEALTSCDGFGTNNDAFYLFTIPASGSVELYVTAENGPNDGGLEMVVKDVCGGTEEAGTCNSAGIDVGETPILINTLTAGTQYVLQIWDDGPAAQEYTFCLNQPCSPPTATATAICQTGDDANFYIEVDVTDMGVGNTAYTVDIAGSQANITATGITTYGPFASGTPVDVVLAGVDNTNCGFTQTGLNKSCDLVSGIADGDAFCSSDATVFITAENEALPVSIIVTAAAPCCAGEFGAGLYEGTWDDGSVIGLPPPGTGLFGTDTEGQLEASTPGTNDINTSGNFGTGAIGTLLTSSPLIDGNTYTLYLTDDPGDSWDGDFTGDLIDADGTIIISDVGQFIDAIASDAQDEVAWVTFTYNAPTSTIVWSGIGAVTNDPDATPNSGDETYTFEPSMVTVGCTPVTTTLSMAITAGGETCTETLDVTVYPTLTTNVTDDGSTCGTPTVTLMSGTTVCETETGAACGTDGDTFLTAFGGTPTGLAMASAPVSCALPAEVTLTCAGCATMPSTNLGLWDPCSCNGDQPANDASMNGIGSFSETVGVFAPMGTLGSIYVSAIATNAAGDVTTPTGVLVNDIFNVIPQATTVADGVDNDNDGMIDEADEGDNSQIFYEISFVHYDGAGYIMEVLWTGPDNAIGGVDDLTLGSIGNRCAYPSYDIDAIAAQSGCLGESDVAITGTPIDGGTGTVTYSGTGVSGTNFNSSGLSGGTTTITATYTGSDDGNDGVSPDNGVTVIYPGCQATATEDITITACPTPCTIMAGTGGACAGCAAGETTTNVDLSTGTVFNDAGEFSGGTAAVFPNFDGNMGTLTLPVGSDEIFAVSGLSDVSLPNIVNDICFTADIEVISGELPFLVEFRLENGLPGQQLQFYQMANGTGMCSIGGSFADAVVIGGPATPADFFTNNTTGLYTVVIAIANFDGSPSTGAIQNEDREITFSNIALSVCSPSGVPGCTDLASATFDPLATVDDGSCEYLYTFNVDANCPDFADDPTTDQTIGMVGLTGPGFGWCGGCNDMTDPDGDGIYSITLQLTQGQVLDYKYQTHDGAGNWVNQEQLVDDAVAGSTCAPVTDFFSFANRQETLPAMDMTFDDFFGSCGNIQGCTDPTAVNYDVNAVCDDGSCLAYLELSDPCNCDLGLDLDDDGQNEYAQETVTINGTAPFTVISTSGFLDNTGASLTGTDIEALITGPDADGAYQFIAYVLADGVTVYDVTIQDANLLTETLNGGPCQFCPVTCESDNGTLINTTPGN